ncbi:type II secretion system F family protein [Anaerosphaera multitolerans]|uniref:Type II secretion system F family protein n=1 Tax=Anaerosphaera multitolerans TaxID=2487351 RepID=A0A437S894_9FIRM|nr:type II secretion system F family protein [Anaerosphaera multitolerans]RVU55309.1 type II secretion system F family protein [Anaerosphaera multitolerans]
MIYKCKVINKFNEVVEEFIETDSKELVLEILRDRNLKPITIERESYGNRELKISKKIFSGEDIQILLYELYVMTKSKIPIPKSFKILSLQEKGKKRESLISIYEDLNRGIPLSESMQKSKLFPSFIVNMVSIGENSSDISIIFKNLSNYYIKEGMLNKKIQGALIYPIILILVTVIIVNFLVFNILPTFENIFNNSDVDLPKMTTFLINISKFINANIIIILLIIISILIVLIIFFKSELGKRKRDSVKLKSSFYRLILGNKILNMMYFLIKSKATVSSTLNIVSKSVENVIIEEKLKSSMDDLKKGVELSTTFKNLKIFPNMVISMLQVGEESSNFEEILKSLVEYYEHEIRLKENRLIQLIEPITIVILSIIVGYVVISIAVPMFDITNRI